MGTENRVIVPSTMAIFVGSPGMSEEVPPPAPDASGGCPRPLQG